MVVVVVVVIDWMRRRGLQILKVRMIIIYVNE